MGPAPGDGGNDWFDTIFAMRIGLVVVDGAFVSGVAALLDIAATAEGCRGDLDEAIAPIIVEVAGRRPQVTTSAGLLVPVTRSLDDLEGFDVVVVPALGTMTGPDTLDALARREVGGVIDALASLDADGRTLAGACTGVFALGEAGHLAGHRATTSWWLWPSFRRRYPAVALDTEEMVVADDRLVTAGAAFAHVDLALGLIRTVSPILARTVARLLVVDERTSQSAYVAVDHLAHDDEIVRAFEHHVRAHLDGPIELAGVAADIGVGRRSLERRVQRALGMSPLVVVQRVRVERALHLLRTTAASVEQVAPQVGYANASTLRALLRRHR